VKLYVCWGTFGSPNGHACSRAYTALTAAGHDPEVVKAYGGFRTDPFFRRRREVKELTGNYKVPTLVLDDGTVVDESRNIAAWAEANPG
jgi:glutathione S-transferase